MNDNILIHFPMQVAASRDDAESKLIQTCSVVQSDWLLATFGNARKQLLTVFII